jgi:hypothetical protein
MDDDGISIRAGRFRRAAARWSEVRTVDATPDAVRLVTADGREQRHPLGHGREPRRDRRRDHRRRAAPPAGRVNSP